MEGAEDGHNALEGGGQISMATSGCARTSGTYSGLGQWRLGGGWRPPLIEGCGPEVATPPLPWTPSSSVHSSGSSKSDSGSGYGPGTGGGGGGSK